MSLDKLENVLFSLGGEEIYRAIKNRVELRKKGYDNFKYIVHLDKLIRFHMEYGQALAERSLI